MPKIAYIEMDFDISAGHFLPDYDGDCSKQHGHNYKVTIQLRGKVQESGFVMDFKKAKSIINSALDLLDHTNLNDLIPNPTAENIAVWIWDKIQQPFGPYLQSVTVQETPSCRVIYRGEGTS